MSVTGKVVNGAIVLPPGTTFPEGAEVKIDMLPAAADDPFVAAVEKLAKPRPHLPKDYALNHGHYVSGGLGNDHRLRRHLFGIGSHRLAATLAVL